MKLLAVLWVMGKILLALSLYLAALILATIFVGSYVREWRAERKRVPAGTTRPQIPPMEVDA